MRSLIFWIALASALSIPLVAGAQTSLPGTGAAVLNPGDALLVTVWRKPELSGEFLVSADGNLAHPLYRELQVAYLPLPALDDRLREFLTRFETNPQFVAVPLLRVAVGGEVRQPNLYSFGPETTLAQAVALAGGPTPGGDLREVRLIRDGSEVEIDLTQPDPDILGMRIRSGDQILISRRRNFFRDYVVPAASLTGAVAAIANIVIRFNN